MFRLGVYACTFIFLVSGLLAVVLGVYTQALYFSGLEELFWQFLFYNSPTFLIISGIITTLFTSVVLYDLQKNDALELLSIKCLVLFMVIVVLMYGVGVIVSIHEINYKVPASLNNSLNSMTIEGTSSTWNYIQSDLECCGVNNASDWVTSGQTRPESCCGGQATAGNCGGCLTSISSVVTNLVHAVEALMGLNAVGILGAVGSLSTRFSNYGNFHL